ncbi:MAG: DNA alkylation repair protein [Pyrinomonadaceae bacterium]
MDVEAIVQSLEAQKNPKNVKGMRRFAIVTKKAFGIPAPQLKKLAGVLKKREDRHELALALWLTEIHECRAIAALIDDPQLVTEAQMNQWAGSFDNWATCDSTCGHLFSRTKFAYKKAYEWAERDGESEEFIKRAGLVLPAWLAVHDKNTPDEKIAEFLTLLESKANDDRNFIKKAVNWSLRGIGKRSMWLNGLAIETAKRIKDQNTKSACWIASNALRELQSETVQRRITKRIQIGK